MPKPSRECERAFTISYLLTFTCYGTRLHGNETGSVDRLHNLPGSRLLEADEGRAFAARALMDQAPCQLDGRRRELVLRAMVEACSHRGWMLFAAHVRTNHVHAVVVADARPEIVMNCFKSYASRTLNRSGLDRPNRKRWTRHGSTRYLWKEEHVSAAISYVVHEQGEPMQVFETSAPSRSRLG